MANNLCLAVFKRGYKVPANLRHLINFSKVPKIDFETEVKEVIAHGSGPGGSNVNKSMNAVTLVHTETKVAVKSHDTRSLAKNRELAKQKLVDKLDWHFNGQASIEAQVSKILKERKLLNKEKAQKRREEKAKLKEEELQRLNSE